MIRNKTLQEIRGVIEIHKRFSTTDFSFKVNDRNLIIRYEYDDKFFYNVSIPSEASTVNKESRETQLMRTIVTDNSYQDYYFIGSCSPGKVSTLEQIKFFGETELHKSITNWLNCLWEELVASPISRQIEEQEEIIRDIQERLKDLPDEYFDPREREELKSKIDALEKTIQQKLETDIEDKNELKRKIEELHKEFETLKATIGLIKKKGWFKSFVTKTFIWFSKEENRKFLKDANEFIKPLLPDSVKNLLPPSNK